MIVIVITLPFYAIAAGLIGGDIANGDEVAIGSLLGGLGVAALGALLARGAAEARAKAAGSGTAEAIGVTDPRMLRALAPARRDSAAGPLGRIVAWLSWAAGMLAGYAIYQDQRTAEGVWGAIIVAAIGAWIVGLLAAGALRSAAEKSPYEGVLAGEPEAEEEPTDDAAIPEVATEE